MCKYLFRYLNLFHRCHSSLCQETSSSNEIDILKQVRLTEASVSICTNTACMIYLLKYWSTPPHRNITGRLISFWSLKIHWSTLGSACQWGKHCQNKCLKCWIECTVAACGSFSTLHSKWIERWFTMPYTNLLHLGSWENRQDLHQWCPGARFTNAFF